MVALGALSAALPTAATAPAEPRMACRAASSCWSRYKEREVMEFTQRPCAGGEIGLGTP